VHCATREAANQAPVQPITQEADLDVRVVSGLRGASDLPGGRQRCASREKQAFLWKLGWQYEVIIGTQHQP